MTKKILKKPEPLILCKDKQLKKLGLLSRPPRKRMCTFKLYPIELERLKQLSKSVSIASGKNYSQADIISMALSITNALSPEDFLKKHKES